MNNKNIFRGGVAVVAMASMLVGCGDSFLEQDPLSFYEPATTYSTEAGLQAALAQCDKQLKTYRIDGNWNNVGIFTNYLMSDVGMYAKTDMGGGFQDNFDAKLTPTSGMAGGGDGNYMQRFWDQGYSMVKYANSILSYVDQVKGLDDATRDAYKGRAYFHRAYAYYNLALQFGDIPLVTKLISVPKRNYTSASKEAIFKPLLIVCTAANRQYRGFVCLNSKLYACLDSSVVALEDFLNNDAFFCANRFVEFIDQINQSFVVGTTAAGMPNLDGDGIVLVVGKC